MQFDAVMNGLVIGKLSGLNTPAALRTGLVSAAIAGNTPEMVTLYSVLFARRELDQAADNAGGVVIEDQDGNGDDNGDDGKDQDKIEGKIDAVFEHAKATAESVKSVDGQVKKVATTLNRTSQSVDRIAEAVKAGDKPSGSGPAGKAGSRS